MSAYAIRAFERASVGVYASCERESRCRPASTVGGWGWVSAFADRPCSRAGRTNARTHLAPTPTIISTIHPPYSLSAQARPFSLSLQSFFTGVTTSPSVSSSTTLFTLVLITP
jgi:hypothetical protein